MNFERAALVFSPEACFGLKSSKNSLFPRRRPVSLDCLRHHPVLRNLDIKTCKHEGRFCGHFSRVVVSDFRSLRGDIVSEALSARQSPAAKSRSWRQALTEHRPKRRPLSPLPVTALSRLHVGVGIGLIAALTDRVLIFAAQPVRHSAEPKAVIAA
ncbi:MAG TPA: hypothetical protein VNY53_14875 [Bradyrhizobium sp.]|nr:hypothetical protein [Bradyrhizobium sp.]